MAPPRTNTHRLSLDLISQIKQLFPSPQHSYILLKLRKGGLELRRYITALGFGHLSHKEILLIEARWDAWKKHYLVDPKAEYFDLPDGLIPDQEPKL
jgi:hypothetical protein